MKNITNKLLILLVIVTLVFPIFGCRRKPNAKGDTPPIRHKIHRTIKGCDGGVCPIDERK